MEPKTVRGRRSPAPDPVTVSALRRHRARQLEQRLAVGARYQDSGLVFTWLDESPIHPLRFSRWFEQQAHRAGLPRIRLHDLRHSYASAAQAADTVARLILGGGGAAQASVNKLLASGRGGEGEQDR